VRILAGDQRFAGILFDGPTGPVQASTADNPDGEQVQVAVGGEDQPVDRVEISGCEIRDSGWHAGVYLEEADGVRLIGNYIHDNGDFADPSQANQSHGIYWHSGSGLIANNLIEHNVARGIQLYQQPHDVTIAHNTIVRNGKTGIQFANDTRDSLAVGNVVALNGEYGIRASDLAGSGNVARGNLLWGNPSGDLALLGKLAAEDNVVQDGRFAPGYRLQATSPGIDRGLPSYAGPIDYLGVPRPLGAAPDIGALESY
jgi:Right handed beta helix region